MSPKTARNIGIFVNKRRKNKSEEPFDRNVKRLKAYMAKLVVLTKKTKEQHRKDPASALNVISFFFLKFFCHPPILGFNEERE